MVLNPDNREHPHAKGSRINQNKLDRTHARKLEDWLENEWPSVEKFKWTRDQTATNAAHKLGFKVTAANVIGAAEVMGKTFAREHKKKALIDRIPRQVLVETIRLASKIGGEMGVVIVPAITQFLDAESDTTNGTNGNDKADS